MKYHEPIPTYLIVLDRIEESIHTKFYVLLKKGPNPRWDEGGTGAGARWESPTLNVC